MKLDNYKDIQKEVKTWFGIDLYDCINSISADGCSGSNLQKIVDYYNENTEESLKKLRRCIHEIKVRLLEKKYNCRLNGEHGYNTLKTIKDFSLNQLADALSFSIWLKQELYKVGVSNFYDICWGVGENGVKHSKGSHTDLLDTLELSARSYNALKRAGINTIDELKKMPIDELRNIRNLGQKCFEEIVSKLVDKGYVISDEFNTDDNSIKEGRMTKHIKLSEQSYNEIIKRFNVLGIELKIGA